MVQSAKVADKLLICSLDPLAPGLLGPRASGSKLYKNLY